MRSWLFWGALALNNVGLLVELVFTVFLTYEFFKRHSKLQHAYYYILYITYIVDILASIAFIVREANGNKKTTPMVGAANAVRWYYYFSPGIWELMFAINRYTAICLPGLHSRMWSGKTLILMLAIVLAFPFLINGYVWLHHPYCIFFEKLRTCHHSLILKLRMSFIINVFLIILALFVVIIGVIISHNNVASHALARVEYKMIVYTVISTLLFIPRYICLLFTFVFESEKYVFYEWTMVLYFLQHYVPIMLLPVMNVIYRKAFIEFNSADIAVEYSSSEEGCAVEYSSSEEEFAYEYDDDIFESDDEDAFVRHRAPVPSGFDDIDSAMKNFGTVFKQRYGNAGPNFRPVTLKAALAEAFDSQEVGLRKPLALYLHNDKSIAANIFAATILSNENVAALLKEQFVVWGCDLTQEVHAVHLTMWLGDVNAVRVADYVASASIDSFPLLLVIQKDRGVIKITASITSVDDVTTVIQKLAHSVTTFDTVKARLMTEARERAERERLRNEQQTAYEIAKEQDRIKFEAREKLLREQHEAEEALAKEEQARIEKDATDKIRHQELASTMPDEPKADAAGIITIKLRFPDNHQEVRRFLRKDSLKLLSHFAGSRGYLASDYRIFTSDFPRKNVSSLNGESTFDELGWPPREQVIVKEI